MRNGLRLLTGLALLATIPLAAQAPTDAQLRRIDSVFASVDGTGRPGCALGVGRDGRPVYLRGYGMSDLQHGLAITPESIFHVASVSKQFTAFAVGLLAGDGKLSLDDPVRKHVSELPAWADSVTVRQMIYHTSGVRDQWELLTLAGWRYPADLFTQRDVMEILKRQRTLNFAPGSDYLYSNGGYSLLAVIVERVSGKSLREFSRERIFEPLGMLDTHVHDDHTMVVPGRTSAYQTGADGRWHISIPVFDTHGATSLFTTVGDLLKWQRNFVTATVGSRALLDEAETSARLNDGTAIDYGFGISVERYRGARATGHGGSDAGYRANVVRFPEHDLAVSVLCNFAAANPGRYARDVADILLADRLAPVAAVSTGKGTASADDLARAAGVYRKQGTDLAWRLDVRDGALVLVNWGVPLEPLGPRRFTAFGGTVEFFGPTGSPATSVRVQFGGQTADSMARITAWRPTPAELRTVVGRYWSDELGVAYEIVERDGAVWLRRPKREDARLDPAFVDGFLVSGLGTVRIVKSRGRAVGLAVTGGRLSIIAFDRFPDGTPVRCGSSRGGPAAGLDWPPARPLACGLSVPNHPVVEERSIRLKPFRAWRPDPAIADRVVSPPYDVVTREEAAAHADGNPFSFLHIGRSDIDVPADVDPYDDRVYLKARDNLNSFMTDGTLVREREPALYLYELTMRARTQVGVVGCVHVADYANDVIKKHERTRPDKENDRTRHVLELNANAEPVFLAYTGQPIVDRLNSVEMRARPLYDIVTPDGVRHRVWRIVKVDEYLDVFRRIPEAYVADGHHRCASAWRAGEERRAANPAHTGDEEYNWFHAVLFPAGQLEILPYHRVVRDLGDLTVSTFLKRLGEIGAVSGSTIPVPDRPGSFGVYVGLSWYRLDLDPSSINFADPIKSLDADLLSDRVLQPILGIDDIRTDPRVDFVGGIHGPEELRRRVDEGEAAVAFALHAVGIEQVMLVADGGGVMPPKSTWFEPKLASGLFVHTLD